jgi:hypothetical protein
MKNRDIKLITIFGISMIIGGIYVGSKNNQHKSTEKAKEQTSQVIEYEKSENQKQIEIYPIAKKSIVQKKVAKKSKLLERNAQLRHKALLSKSERAKLDDYFSDSSHIRKAWLTLNSMNFEDYEVSMKNRITATNFMIDGLKYAKTNRDEIIKSIEMFLISEKEDHLPLKEKKLVVGDKIDLYHALVLHAPEELEKFKANYSGKRLNLIMKYVDHHTRRKL